MTTHNRGTIVRHKLTGERMIVLDSWPISDGTDRVKVRRTNMEDIVLVPEEIILDQEQEKSKDKFFQDRCECLMPWTTSQAFPHERTSRCPVKEKPTPVEKIKELDPISPNGVKMESPADVLLWGAVQILWAKQCEIIRHLNHQ